MTLSPYIRIMQAAEKGAGVRLSAEDVFYMAQDSSISQVAHNVLNGIEVDGGGFIVAKDGFYPKESQP